MRGTTYQKFFFYGRIPLILQKKKNLMVVRLLFVISIVIESNLTYIQLKLRIQIKTYVLKSLKKYDGYKALKILEVISILTFKKSIVVDSQKISAA